jgi:uncharacterized protein YaeQ
MALGATIHTFDIELADIDRGVYESLTLRVAQHPSETPNYMVTRLLAYCLEYQEGIDFGGDISATSEPAVVVRDLTGRLTAWIEVGAPDANRMHHGSKSAEHAAVYTHRDPEKVLASWAGKPVHRAKEIEIYSFDPGFIDAVAHATQRRNTLTISKTEQELFLDLNGTTLGSTVHIHVSER